MTALPPDLEAPPPSARLPRIATSRNPRTVGSYGPEMLAWCDERKLHPKRSSGWRWWQRYVARRALEHDEDGELVWRTVIISTPRQQGKSWLERGVCAWRMDQADRWQEEQSVLHVAHKLVAAKETWRPAARWAVGEEGWSVRWQVGEERIENEAGSRWMLQAASDGAGVPFSLSMALCDEAWRIRRQVVDGAIGPTLAEAASSQLWLVSTAGTSDSDLMAVNRAAAIAMAEADDPGNVLLLEWSAPPLEDLDIDDPRVWQEACAHWDDRRLEFTASMRAQTNEYEFMQQYLNLWTPTVQTRALVEPKTWNATATADASNGTPCFAFDVAPDRSSAVVIACAGSIIEVVASGDGVSWLADEVRRLAGRWEASSFVADAGGPAITVVDEVADELGDRLVQLKTRDVVAACASLYDAVVAGILRHRPHHVLDGAVSEAGRRQASGSWVFDRARPVVTCCSPRAWPGGVNATRSKPRLRRGSSRRARSSWRSLDDPGVECYGVEEGETGPGRPGEPFPPSSSVA